MVIGTVSTPRCYRLCAQWIGFLKVSKGTSVDVAPIRLVSTRVTNLNESKIFLNFRWNAVPIWGTVRFKITDSSFNLFMNRFEKKNNRILGRA